MHRGLGGATFNIALNKTHKTTYRGTMVSKYHKGNPMLRDEESIECNIKHDTSKACVPRMMGYFVDVTWG